jgi:PIN domain nuclease of toxin-antitoxin system
LTDGFSSVLDASALLAHLNDEEGADAVEAALVRGSAISAVNLAEVLSKLAELGEEPANAFDSLRRQGLFGTKLSVLPVTEADAVKIAAMHGKTRVHGLSLGDRACLALALRLGLPAFTADRAWARLKVGVKVETIR